MSTTKLESINPKLPREVVELKTHHLKKVLETIEILQSKKTCLYPEWRGHHPPDGREWVHVKINEINQILLSRL